MLDGKLIPSEITRNLPTRFIGQRVLYYPSVTSTNEVARLNAQKKAPEGTVVVAEQQTAGRGRLKRLWLTPEGNIACSVILYPTKTYLHSLIMLVSLAVADAMGKVTGLKCQLKWPNDVLINGKKVCGILIETRTQVDSVDYAIIGIGINVNMRLADYSEIQAIATSLADEMGNTVSRVALLRQLFIDMERLYLAVISGEDILERWRNRLITLGKKVHIRSGDDVFEGIAESVAEDGSLNLRQADGTLRNFMAGDVTLRS
jgi:BirA family biotin operon repressor/biotin-[acetyl-CoA-carboxylase] ligase